MDIWVACKDAVAPQRLAGELARMVESQEQVATNALVDSLEEQSLLEQMLEASKPAILSETAHLHYLLATPFRYPPLRHGSRFGTRHEPGLFYGSKDLSAALAETAYYRLLFWSGMEAAPPAGRLTTEHTAFGARYSAARGLLLHAEPFLRYQERLLDPQDYADTQKLGRSMRAAGIEAFEYRSARDPDSGMNIGLYRARAFAHPQPLWQEPWLCETRADRVAFYNKAQGTRLYQREQFLVAGELPAPAV